MTQNEFFARYWAILDVDCRKGNLGNISRTLTDREAEVFAQHLWELFERGPAAELDAAWMTQALLRTHHKFQSFQEQAAAIVAMKG